MFTFIRIAYHQALVSRQGDKAARRPARSPQADSEREVVTPWEDNLHRMAADRGEPQVKIRSWKGIPLKEKPPEAPAQNYKGKQGTLTDLKIWWGQATATANTRQKIDVRSFAPGPARKPNRWYQ